MMTTTTWTVMITGVVLALLVDFFLRRGSVSFPLLPLSFDEYLELQDKRSAFERTGSQCLSGGAETTTAGPLVDYDNFPWIPGSDSSLDPSSPPSTDASSSALDQPLHEYFIKTSHNTYLTGNQLTSSSSAERYREDLRKGYRCVEIDSWDSWTGPPVVKHGFTVTPAVSLEDVLWEVRWNAFPPNSTSHLPVIISLECHNAPSKQDALVQLFRKIFVDEDGNSMLLTPQAVHASSGKLKSPLQLQGKVLILADVVPRRKDTDNILRWVDSFVSKGVSQGREDLDDDADNVRDSEEIIDVLEVGNGDGCLALAELRSRVQSATDFDPRIFKTEWDALDMDDDGCVSSAELAGPTGISAGKEADQFCSLPIVAGAPSLDLPPANHVFNQKEAQRMSPNKRLTRIYPKGSKVLSDNLDPFLEWLNGNQLVALNSQTNDVATLLNDALFDSHHNNGYRMRTSVLSTLMVSAKDRKSLRVRVVSASNLPVSNSGWGVLDRMSHVWTPWTEQLHLSPFVELTLTAAIPAADESDYVFNTDQQTLRSDRVINNLVNPAWNWTAVFEPTLPTAVLHVAVRWTSFNKLHGVLADRYMWIGKQYLDSQKCWKLRLTPSIKVVSPISDHASIVLELEWL